MPERKAGICPQTEKECKYKKDVRRCPELDFEYCKDFAVISGSVNKPLVQEVASILESTIPVATTMFPDNETSVKIPESVRGKNVFIIQSGQPNPNDRIVEAALMIDAADRASAKEITVMFTYFPYSRKDRKDESRVPISSAVMASILKEAGARRILTIDLHAEQEEGFVTGPWDNLYASYVLVPKIKDYINTEGIVASPDAGGVPRANFYAKKLGCDRIAVAPKIRNPQNGNEATSLGVIGDVKDRDVLLVDDIIDSAGTLAKAAKNLKAAGAKSIVVAAPHGLFSGNAIKNISDSPIDKLYVTNTIEQKKEVLDCPKIEVVSIAPLIASAICRIQSARSLDQLILTTNNT